MAKRFPPPPSALAMSQPRAGNSVDAIQETVYGGQSPMLSKVREAIEAGDYAAATAELSAKGLRADPGILGFIEKVLERVAALKALIAEHATAKEDERLLAAEMEVLRQVQPSTLDVTRDLAKKLVETRDALAQASSWASQVAFSQDRLDCTLRVFAPLWDKPAIETRNAVDYDILNWLIDNHVEVPELGQWWKPLTAPSRRRRAFLRTPGTISPQANR